MPWVIKIKTTCRLNKSKRFALPHLWTRIHVSTMKQTWRRRRWPRSGVIDVEHLRRALFNVITLDLGQCLTASTRCSRDENGIKSLFLFSIRFVTLLLNHWRHMDYFVDHLGTFLCLDRGSSLAVCGRVRELSDSINNIFNCVLNMNKGPYRCGRTLGWVINDVQ